MPLNGLAVQIAVTAQSGKSRFEIRLDPADLGRIDVRLDVDRQGQVTSHLTVEKPETLAMLRQDAPQFQRALQDAGLKTGDGGLQFSLRDQSSSRPERGNDTGRNAQRLIMTEDDIVPAAAAGRTMAGCSDRAAASTSGFKETDMAVDATMRPRSCRARHTPPPELDRASADSNGTLAGNFQTFLTLLTTQLQNQNPLDPLDTNQFTQQLVQFAGVEQQLKTNDQLTALVSLREDRAGHAGAGLRRQERRRRRQHRASSTARRPGISSAAKTECHHHDHNAAGQNVYTGGYPFNPGNAVRLGRQRQ